MKRTFKLALMAVLGAALVVPALAQDNFPDVPDNHWAYEALLRMKSNGLLVGYPDGLFRGPRPASRYEMAVAIHATYVNLKNITDGLQKQIDDLKAQIGAGTGGDTSNLKTALENLQAEVAGMKKWGDDIAALRRMADTFQKELQDLNVNVEQMKKDLADLQDRVKRLEDDKPLVKISGDATIWAGTGFSVDDNVNGYLSKDGRRAGYWHGGSFGRDLSVLQEGALTLTTTNETGPKFKGTFVFGNAVQAGTPGATQGALFNQSQMFPGTSYYDNGSADVYVQEFGVHFDTPTTGFGIGGDFGRIGYKVSPYIYQRADTTTYFDNDRWDNGKWIFDGALVSLGFGGHASLDVFTGRTSNRLSVNGVELQPQTIFGSNADRILGANLSIPIGERGKINAAYLLHDLDRNVVVSPTEQVNRLEVIGADATFGLFKDFSIGGGYHISNYKRNDDSVDLGTDDEDRTAWNVTAGYNTNAFGVNGEYREIGFGYSALGDWGRVGIFRNPTDIKGFKVDAYVNLGQAITLKGGGEWDQGKTDSDDKINSYNVGIDWRVSPRLSLLAGYEWTEFEFAGGGSKPKYSWYNLGVAYSVSPLAKLRVGLEFSDVENDFFVDPSNSGTYKGGFLTTQLSIKF